MPRRIDRRSFTAGSVSAAAGAAWSLASLAAPPAARSAETAPAAAASTAFPRAKIGELELSRLLLGGNLLTHYTHSRDLRYVYSLAKHYNTREKIFQTMAAAEAAGINTLVIHTAPNVREMLKEYREKRGGKIQAIVCPTAPIEPGLARYAQEVQRLADDGIEAIYLWGVRTDALVKEGKIDLVAKAVELARAQGLPSGVGAHTLAAIQACEKHQVPADFYIKTLHHHKYPSAKLDFDSMWCTQPEETIEFMRGVSKPWIAFKVMAAGAIPPQDAFRYAFRHGADVILAGMFDYEIAEDVAIAVQSYAAERTRPRPWRA